MKCYSNNATLLFLFLILSSVMCKVLCIKCYQCSSTYQRGCFKYNLNNDYLKECKNVGRVPPVCRSLSQINYFTAGQDVTVLRECAYVYNTPLQCVQSKFSAIHFSYVCECDTDGCNSAINVRQHFKILVYALALVMVIT